MIKSEKHANTVQLRRFLSGKKGVAKSVRRFNKRKGPSGFLFNLKLPSNFEGCRTYEETHEETHEEQK